MKFQSATHISEKGQSLVTFVILSLVFLGILALVLDGGMAYAQRRVAQNASDAGALAGARELCVSGDYDAARNVAWDYAVNENRASQATINFPAAGEIQVVSSVIYPTFAASMFGQDVITATTVAEAGCFPPGSGVGVLPIAWSCAPPDYWDEPYPHDCTLQYQEGNTCTLGDDPMYIVVDSDTIAEDVYCQDPPNSGLPAGTLDCDIDNDGANDVAPISGGNRSWLDLDGGGGGASSLSAWIQNGFPGEIDVHTWFAGQTGVAVSVYDTTYDYQLGNHVIIPIFDQFCPSPPATGCPGLVHPEDTIVLSGGASTDYFHIISFALFHITCIDAGSHGPCPAHDALDLKNINTIEGCFVEGFDPGLGGGEPGTGVDVGAYTIYLTR